MASVYPNNPDAFDRTTPSDPLTGHSDLHDDISDAVENIQAFVGVSGDTTAGTVVKRVTDLEQKDITLTLSGDVTGSATFTNLGNATLTAVVADDSHNHVIGNVDGLQTAIDGKDRIPSGTVSMFAGATAPSGWLLCNGAAVSRTTYADLFAVIGTTYGAGNGSTTFTLPDMRNRAPVGAGSSYTLGQAFGATTDSITLSSANLPKHTHGLNGHTHSIDPPSTSVSVTVDDNGTDLVTRLTSYTGQYVIPYDSNNNGLADGLDGYGNYSASSPTPVTGGMAASYTTSHGHTASGTVNIGAFNSGGNSGNTTDGGFANSAISVDIVQPSRGLNFIIRV